MLRELKRFRHLARYDLTLRDDRLRELAGFATEVDGEARAWCSLPGGGKARATLVIATGRGAWPRAHPIPQHRAPAAWVGFAFERGQLTFGASAPHAFASVEVGRREGVTRRIRRIKPRALGSALAQSGTASMWPFFGQG